jgi:hypothetical protein
MARKRPRHCPGVCRAGFGAVKIAITIRSITANRKVVSITIRLRVVNTDFDFFPTALMRGILHEANRSYVFVWSTEWKTVLWLP